MPRWSKISLSNNHSERGLTWTKTSSAALAGLGNMVTPLAESVANWGLGARYKAPNALPLSSRTSGRYGD